MISQRRSGRKGQDHNGRYEIQKRHLSVADQEHRAPSLHSSKTSLALSFNSSSEQDLSSKSFHEHHQNFELRLQLGGGPLAKDKS
jgi:hypothetical protein